MKPARLSREGDGWYVSFSCAEVLTQPLPLTDKETGIDVGLKVFLVTADGDIVENPRHYRKSEHALKKANKRVRRRKKGTEPLSWLKPEGSGRAHRPLCAARATAATAS